MRPSGRPSGKIIGMTRALKIQSLGSVTLFAATLVGATLGSGVARADCGTDIQALMQKRMAQIAALNQNTRSHAGKLDPTLACPQLRSLAAIEGQVVAYMTKNKDWCSLPDDLITKMSDSRGRTAGIAVKACDVAVKMKKAQQQQATAAAQPQQTIKLPTGPL